MLWWSMSGSIEASAPQPSHTDSARQRRPSFRDDTKRPSPNCSTMWSRVSGRATAVAVLEARYEALARRFGRSWPEQRRPANGRGSPAVV